ncbi:23S rRNA pseudouridine1911/1915/1917 synthase [Pullulanibacillus pueri]|uniref:Pseudouridine synthase n=1 Tax=Pullulanibacillus pueri TaxID=1437324 RepID=A0A8J2ZXS2_9BACL|nr:RluA family pseudouridine synthase [Pullulanibacillus pueri]MBM7680602.1 23S rRNA pseudouridine1911/1915/1917 synthase [Pullulanibacillus pueri]GGH83968.1 pseudouridine synthase [Pullulanibacillus pueri]
MKPLILKQKVTSESEGWLLRDFLITTMKLSRTAIKKVKHEGGSLYVNGQPATVRTLLHAQDRIEVHFPPEVIGEGIRKTPLAIDLLFEDETLMILNKPAGQPTVPSFQNRETTLANGVLYYLQEQEQLAFTAHPVTRLDRDTSGLVLFAKHSVAHDWFVRMQKQGDIHRRYLALVHGCFEQESGTIEAPIGRKTGSIIERCVTDEGKPAITHFEVIAQWHDFSLLSIKLETGRTHQIRVHFSHMGHPLLGDDLYGGSTQLIKRHALHSYQIDFRHPMTHQPLTFTTPLPEDMRRIIEHSRFQRDI